MPTKSTKSASTPANAVDLAKLFQTVASSLAENRDQLNQADTYNRDHGDNMVNTFNTIAQVVGKLKGKDQSVQLASAAKELRKSKSGSAQLYASGLENASKQYKGGAVTLENAGMLLQSLLGSQAPASPAPQQAAPPQQGGDLLGSLLGSLTSGSGTSSQNANADNGLDMGDLLNAGMAFMNTRQKGGSTAEAAINALLSASPMGQSEHRSQSGTLVANTIMQVLGSLGKK